MARILLSEPDPDARRLLVLLLERLGHEVVALGRHPAVPPVADLLVLEPRGRHSVDHALLVRSVQPGLPLLCFGPPPGEPGALGSGPVAVAAKPFSLAELRAAVSFALASRPRAA